jgi:hypothetical protein
VDKSLHIRWVLWVYLADLSKAENLSKIYASAMQKLTKRLSES